jgi:hypothetical protein
VKKQLLVPPSWYCASSCIATDLWLFGQHKVNCASSATLLTWPGFSRLFPKLKSTLKGQRFKRLQKIRRRSYAWSRKRRTRTFQKWQQRWEQCINAGGEYIEGDKAHSVAGMSEKIIKK